MIIKVEENINNSSFGIKNIYVFEREDYHTSTILLYINVNEIIRAYVNTNPKLVIILKDKSRIEIEFGYDKCKNAERLVNHIFKMKMYNTKWEYENPEKYI